MFIMYHVTLTIHIINIFSSIQDMSWRRMDFSDARNFRHQSCNCTIITRWSGTFLFKSIVTPPFGKPCGSRIQLHISEDDSQKHVIECAGNLTMSVSTGDKIIITIYNVGNKTIYDTDYCYILSISTYFIFTSFFSDPPPREGPGVKSRMCTSVSPA